MARVTRGTKDTEPGARQVSSPNQAPGQIPLKGPIDLAPVVKTHGRSHKAIESGSPRDRVRRMPRVLDHSHGARRDLIDHFHISDGWQPQLHALSKEETTGYTLTHGLEPDRACRVHSVTSAWHSTLQPNGQCALSLESKRAERLASTTGPTFLLLMPRLRSTTYAVLSCLHKPHDSQGFSHS